MTVYTSNLMISVVWSRFELSALDMEVPGSVPGRTNLGNELFYFGSGLVLFQSKNQMITWSQNRDFFVLGVPERRTFTLKHLPEQSTRSNLREVHLSNWFYQESNPIPRTGTSTSNFHTANHQTIDIVKIWC